MSSSPSRHSDGGENTPAAPDVLTKYQTAGNIANRVVSKLATEAVAGKSALALCVMGDGLIQAETANVYKAKDKDGKVLSKGIAFPTCVSVNACAGHFSPVDEQDDVVLKDGDVVKIDLGVQIDGFPAVVAHTVIVGGTATDPRVNDLLAATQTAAEGAFRLLRPDAEGTEITKLIAKVAEAYGVEAVDVVQSHDVGQHRLDGDQVIANKHVPEQAAQQKLEPVKFESYDVYSIDIVMSTGEGKARERELKAMIFRRRLDATYNLKMKASRQTLSEVTTKFGAFAFSLRHLTDGKSRLGMTECKEHELVTGYPVLYEKEGEFVAQYKFTAVITPTQTHRLTGLPYPQVKSDKKVTDEETLAVLARSTGKKRNKKNKNKPAAAAAAAAPATQ